MHFNYTTLLAIAIPIVLYLLRPFLFDIKRKFMNTTSGRDRASDLLEQAMESGRLQKSLSRIGKKAEGKIISVTAIGTLWKDTQLMRLVIEVKPENEPPFTAETTLSMNPILQTKFIPGFMVNVKYNPEDKTQIVLSGIIIMG